jgi:hypothetical protein
MFTYYNTKKAGLQAGRLGADFMTDLGWLPSGEDL